MNVQTYRVTLERERRAYYFRTAASTPEQAAAQVCAAEGAPRSAVIGVEEVPAIVIRTPSDLKRHVEANGHDPHYFDRSSMAFFGDTMRNYGTRSKPVNVTTPSGEVVACWELYRKRPVKHGLSSSSYFACDNFRRVFADKSKHICHACDMQRILSCGHHPSPHSVHTTGTAHTPDGREICWTCADQEQREELKDRTKPASGYLSSDGRTVTTWTGGHLGNVTSTTTVRLARWSSFHGKTMQAIRVRDIHGGMWHGRTSPGMCVNLRPLKG